MQRITGVFQLLSYTYTYMSTVFIKLSMYGFFSETWIAIRCLPQNIVNLVNLLYRKIA